MDNNQGTNTKINLSYKANSITNEKKAILHM